MMHDLIIIGGGPAGISAALYAARQKMDFLLITKDIGGLANFIPELKTYLGIYYIDGFGLVQKFREHLKEFNVPLKEGESVSEITQSMSGFSIKTDKSVYRARTVIIASGRRFRKLGVKGEDAFTNKGLSYCAACDGPLFKGKTIAIIGGGRSGLFSALFMASLAKKIYLIEKETKIKGEGGLKGIADAIKSGGKVEVITGARVTEVAGNSFVGSVKFVKGGKEKSLKVDGIFVEVGYEPNTGFAKDLVELNGRGEVIIDKNNMSDMPGVFAAGDVADLHEKQVIVAVGEGAKAVLSAIMYLERSGKAR